MVKQQNDLMTAINTVISLLNDAYRILNGSYTQKDLARDIATVSKRGSKEGLGFFTRTLPNISKGLLSYLEGYVPLYSNFGMSKHGYPSFLKGIFRLAYTECDCQIDAIRLIYQVGDGFKKLNGPFVDSELEEQLNSFIQTDQSLVIEPSDDDPILVLARSYVTTIFKHVDDNFKDELVPRPGPGATNDPLKITNRYQPNKIFDSLDEVFNTQEWFYPTYWEGSWDRANLIKLYKKSQVEPSARFKFVPKKVGTARGICIEFNEMQYLQQGLKGFLYKHLEKHWLTRDEIHFSEQGYNRHLAQVSSVGREYATLDMKDGSNRILRSIVEFLFSRLPNMSEVLNVLSSRFITFDNVIKSGKGFKIIEPLKANMFAPMGSGICFPIMSIVHFALIKAIQAYMHNAPHDHFLVYGDDLIVKTEYVNSLFDIMPKYGMKFNIDKSFSKGFFRESCGLHAFKSEDVTPIYFKYMSNNDNPKAVMSIIENESMATKKGYDSLARFMRMQQQKIKLLAPEQSNIVGWKRPIFKVKPMIGFTYKVRWSQEWQRFQERLPTFHVEKQGSTPRMPKSWETTVLTEKQIKSLKKGTNWNEHTAYLRSLLVSAEDHAYHWDNTGIIKYRHSWV